jgi:uncharacterized membrane protein YhaH (DUF805 family)
MNFVDAVQACFVKYVKFDGCASRAEFWWWFVFTLVVTATLRLLSNNVGHWDERRALASGHSPGFGGNWPKIG